jgi:LmeA-like phospholipid-binding
MYRRCAGLVVIASLLVAVLPARAALSFASVEVLRPILARMLGNPPQMRLDVVPDTYEGGYARISVYAQGAGVGGMRIDEVWMRLVGASFDPTELRRGTLKLLQLRDSGVFGRLKLQSIEAFLHQQGTIKDVRLSWDEDLVVAAGTLNVNGVPAQVRLKGAFQVYGEPEIRFHIQSLVVNGLPVPYVVVERLEQQMNPVVDFRSWPVPFKIRSLRNSQGGFVLSSQRDFSQPCKDCGGPELRLTP